MKKCLFALMSVGAIVVGVSAHATSIANCIGYACFSGTPVNSIPNNCASYTSYCYGDDVVYNCTQCNSGYKLDGGTVEVDSCSNAVNANNCILDCTGCTDCDTTEWSVTDDGYEARTYASCSCNTCTKTTQYRCAAGYYGGSTNGTSGCASCKNATSNDNATSAAGSTTITSCYIPSETSMTDDSGTYEYTSDCYYSE